jgi:hypothetical protein
MAGGEPHPPPARDLSGEFDPGSERTLAACLTHASRARKGASAPEYSGERVSNTWVICPQGGNNLAKAELMPDTATGDVPGVKEGFVEKLFFGEEPATYQLVGRVMAYQGKDG